jgi:hypothetical protein
MHHETLETVEAEAIRLYANHCSYVDAIERNDQEGEAHANRFHEARKHLTKLVDKVFRHDDPHPDDVATHEKVLRTAADEQRGASYATDSANDYEVRLRRNDIAATKHLNNNYLEYLTLAERDMKRAEQQDAASDEIFDWLGMAADNINIGVAIADQETIAKLSVLTGLEPDSVPEVLSEDHFLENGWEYLSQVREILEKDPNVRLKSEYITEIASRVDRHNPNFDTGTLEWLHKILVMMERNEDPETARRTMFYSLFKSWAEQRQAKTDDKSK